MRNSAIYIIILFLLTSNLFGQSPLAQKGISLEAGLNDTYENNEESSLACLVVTFNPISVVCGTSEVDALINCSFSGWVSLHPIGSPNNVQIPSQNLLVSNGHFSFDVTVFEGASGSIDIVTVVESVISDPDNCVLTQTCEPSFLITTCVIPDNDNCQNAAELVVSYDECEMSYFSNVMSSSSSVSSSCSGSQNKDLFFSFEAINEALNIEISELPSSSMSLQLLTSCFGSELYCSDIQNNSIINIEGLVVGENYHIRISDDPGADEGDVGICLWSPPICTMIPTINRLTDESCEGLCDGSAEVEIQQGNPPFTYLWSSGGTGTMSTGLCPGMHYVTITDVLGCVISDSIYIEEGIIFMTEAGQDTFTCSGAPLQLNASGGVDFSWTPATFLNDSTLANPVATVYDTTLFTLNAIDQNGCTSSDEILLIANKLPHPVITGDSAFCVGNSIQLSADPGYLSYNWSSGDSNHFIVINDTLNYSLSVSDSLGCVGSASFQATYFPMMSTSFTLTHEGGNGFNNGSALVETEGGNAPFQYTWSTGDSTQLIQNLAPGSYEVSISDNNLCIINDSISIDSFICPALSIISEIIASSCYKTCDGMIEVSEILNAVGMAHISWNNGASTPSINNLCAGTYTVNVIDSLNCSVQQSFIIEEPDSIEMNVESILHYKAGQKGAIDITTNGNYSFYWTGENNFESILEDIDELEVACYTLVITDTLTNCSIDTTICIDDLSAVFHGDWEEAGIKIYPNPVNDQLTISFKNTPGKATQIKIFDLTGKVMLSSGIKSDSDLIHLNTSSLNEGIYMIRIEIGEKNYYRKILVQH